MAEWSKARVCDRPLAGVVGSNPAGAVNVCVVNKSFDFTTLILITVLLAA